MSRPFFVLLFVATLGLGTPAAAIGSSELLGTWHVLVHYKDSATPNPDAKRWEDRIWEFSLEGTRVRWVDYPIVVFENQTGRFEPGASGRPARVLDYWEPNQGQTLQIQQGLEINHRGSRSKTLRGSDTKGWTTAKKKRGYQSASVITFEETWSIEMDAGLPRFERLDVMGSAASESLEGRTLYITKEVRKNGDVLTGSFDRDGTRRGTFRMTRAGATRTVGSKGKGADFEEVEEKFFQQMGEQLFEGSDIDEKALRAKIQGDALTEDERREFASAVEDAVEAEYRRQGNDPMRYRLEVRNLTEDIVNGFIDGASLDQLRNEIGSGRIRP